LVISADSENMIVANKEVKNGKITGFNYKNGAIEDINIRSKAINILEGGKTAFINRGEKLEIIKK